MSKPYGLQVLMAGSSRSNIVRYAIHAGAVVISNGKIFSVFPYGKFTAHQHEIYVSSPYVDLAHRLSIPFNDSLQQLPVQNWSSHCEGVVSFID